MSGTDAALKRLAIGLKYCEMICASFLNDVSKWAIDEFESDLKRVWRLACTYGKVETLKYDAGLDRVSSRTGPSASIQKFVDSQRNLTQILSLATSRSVTSGSKPLLVAQTRKASEMRYRFNYNGFSVFRQADNLKISGEGVAAMHLRAIIEDTISPTFMNSSFCFHTILSTTGRIEMSRCKFPFRSSEEHDYRTVGADRLKNKSF